MTKYMVKPFHWMGLMSGVGLMALSAAAFASPSASAAAPAASTNLQLADAQESPKKQPPSQHQQPPREQVQQQKQPQQQGVPQQQTQQQKQPLQQAKQPTQQQVQQEKQPPQQPNQPPQQQSQQRRNQQGHRYDWAAYQPGQRPPQWRQYSQNFDARTYQGNRDSERSYHSQPYMHSEGWSYRRWGYGEVLPAAYWGRGFWLDSYFDFGLIDPPYGYVWVRYGPDALLVDVANGQILSVMYAVFA